jgi:hypothetical protein
LKNLKDLLKNCLDKRNRLTRSGTGASTLPKCKYFELLFFLHEKSANKPTESNVPTIPQTLSSDVLLMDSLTQESPSTSVIHPPTSLIHPPVKVINRKKRGLDDDLEKSLADCDALLKNTIGDEEDEDNLYCRSLAPIMRELPKKKKRLAKIQISQLLFKLQYDDEE